mmetsp:Transcript_3885/g.6466  ORF Transcript_3885/g.6466 Transcript_3885/m.6466 type:complete len:140 (+) Transcript_3885:1-420(+)
MFDSDCMENLRRLVQQSQADIVLSSSWRCSEIGIDEVNSQLRHVGLREIIGVTPTTGFQTRSDEILEWLSHHPSVEHFVALDDMDLSFPHGEPFIRHFLHTDTECGLTAADADRAIEILQQKVNRAELPKPITQEETLW